MEPFIAVKIAARIYDTPNLEHRQTHKDDYLLVDAIQRVAIAEKYGYWDSH